MEASVSASGGGRLTVQERSLVVLYPLLTGIGLAFVTRLVLTPGVTTPALWTLAVAYLCTVFGDLTYAFTQLDGGVPAALPDALTALTWVLVPAGLLHPSAASLTTPVEAPIGGLGRRRIGVLTLASLLPPIVLATQALWSNSVAALSIAAASVLLVMLVLVRMAELVHRVRSQAQDLQRLSATDPLTGAANRRGWDTALAEAAARAQRTGTALSVALADLDHFKRFNDSRGHAAGDELLRGLVGTWHEPCG